jgi:hypothetical protein
MAHANKTFKNGMMTNNVEKTWAHNKVQHR